MTDPNSPTPPPPERSDVRLPGPSHAGASIHLSWGRTKITTVKVIRLTFKNDHGLLTDSKSDWTTAGAPYPKPEWTSGTRSFPVSYQKNQSITVEVDFQVYPNDADETDADVTGTATFGSLVFTAKKSFKGGVVTVSANSTGPLPDNVNVLKGDIAWSVNTAKDGPLPPAGSSLGHTTYTTYGTPYCSTTRDNEVTEKRLSFLCNLCKGQSN
jgi:hypothetical protein